MSQHPRAGPPNGSIDGASTSNASDATDSLDAHSTLRRDSYERDFLPVYHSIGITPKRLIQFPIILPFHLPFPAGTCLTFAFADADACTLAFQTVSSTQHLHAGIVSETPIVVPIHRSKVEMTYVVGGTEAPSNERELSDAFDDMLSALNSVISAYMVVTKDYRVHRTTKEMLEFGSVYRVIDPPQWDNATASLFLLHLQAPFVKPEMSHELRDEVVHYATVIQQGLNPFVVSAELFLTAQRTFLGGSYQQAVIFAQTAVETMLASLLSRAMHAEGASAEDFDRMMSDVSFMTRLKKEYHPRFGGLWQPLQADSIVGRWYANTYLLRNRISHAGYMPRYAETEIAVDAATSMQRYVLALVKKSANRYPGLQQYLK